MANDVLSVKPSEAIDLLDSMVDAKQPTLILGPPGVGKSSIMRQIAKKRDIGFIDLRLAMMDPTDLMGLPAVVNGKTAWQRPTFWPTEGAGIILLDELPQAPQMMQNAGFQIALDHRIGEHRLPEGWVVMAAGNRVEDRAGAGRLNTALANRFLHVDLEVSVDDWQAYALEAGIAPEVRGFINFKPGLLFQFDPTTNPRAFPSPRSWEFVSRVLNKAPKDLLKKAVAGCVGSGPAAEFETFLIHYKNLPDIDNLLANPTTVSLPSKQPSVMFALISALVDRCRNNKKLVPAFAKIGMRLPDEFSVLALNDALKMDRMLAADKDVQKWVKEATNKGLLVKAA